MLPSLTGYVWNSGAARYIDVDTGQFVSSSSVRDALESIVSASALDMNNLGEQLASGEISLADFQAGMMEQIKISHTAASAAANGGWAQMSQSDWGYVGSEVKEQYQYLQAFVNQIENGEQPLDGRFLVRVDLYADAPIGSYEAMRGRMMEANGFEEEKWELQSKDGNNCDGCLEQAGKGWVTLGELDDIGDEDCQVRCRCEKIYRRVDENGNWEVSD